MHRRAVLSASICEVYRLLADEHALKLERAFEALHAQNRRRNRLLAGMLAVAAVWVLGLAWLALVWVLFLRRGTRLQLTAAGEQLVRHARQLVALNDRAIADKPAQAKISFDEGRERRQGAPRIEGIARQQIHIMIKKKLKK